MRTGRLAVFGAILAGALLLAWPAILNGYPIVFSDTWGYIDQGYQGVSWDKPWIYGPLIRALHWGVTLWPVVAAQALLLSTMLWLVQRTLLTAPSPLAHIALCALLATACTAPWFVGLAMPDIFTPLVPLCLFMLAFHDGRLSRATLLALLALATVLIAAHFSHLPMAAACLAVIAAVALHDRLRWRTPVRAPWRPAIALASATLLLLAINLVGRGQLALSPAGSVFMLARLTADGPAAAYLEAACPAAGYHLCDWKGRFPTDSDAFLWASDGPLYKDDYGAPRLAPEAAEIVRRTVLAYPGQVAATATRNVLKQLGMVRLGDAIAPDHLDSVLRDTIAAVFPPAELARFEAGMQFRGTLRPVGEALNAVHVPLLALGATISALIAVLGWRRHARLAAFALLLLVSVAANATVTGALSTPHDRYQARIAWVLLLPPAFLALFYVKRRPRPDPRPQPPAVSRSSAG